jgi:hypothetical protein
MTPMEIYQRLNDHQKQQVELQFDIESNQLMRTLGEQSSKYPDAIINQKLDTLRYEIARRMFGPGLLVG